MKKLVLATMAIVLFVSNINAQEKLSAEDNERLQEIVKKVTTIAEEKARIVTFELNYKESFELANFAVDEESELAKKISSSLDEATFNALKGNVKLTYGNGDFEVFATDDMNNIGNAILAHAKERPVKGLYVPRSLDGSLSYGQDSNFKKFFESSEFAQLSKKFSINPENIDKNNFGSIDHESKKYKIYRVLVSDDKNKNFITFFTDDDGISYGLAYEKIDLDNNKAEHYDEYGNLYATFIVTKADKDMWKFKIDKVYSPELTGNPTNQKGTCVGQIYRKLKKACEADADCDLLCDIHLFCHTMLIEWAIAYCIIH